MASQPSSSLLKGPFSWMVPAYLNSPPVDPGSVTSKALLFIGFALSQYLLPEAARCAIEGRHALRQLAMSLALLAVPAVSLLLVAVVAPEVLLRIVFGPDLVTAAPALATLVLATWSLAASVLLAYYLLGAGRHEVVAVLAVGVVVLALALMAADGEPSATAGAMLACDLALAGALGMVTMWSARAAPVAAPP